MLHTDFSNSLTSGSTAAAREPPGAASSAHAAATAAGGRPRHAAARHRSSSRASGGASAPAAPRVRSRMNYSTVKMNNFFKNEFRKFLEMLHKIWQTLKTFYRFGY